MIERITSPIMKGPNRFYKIRENDLKPFIFVI